MALNQGAIRSYGDITNRIWTSPLSVGTAPTAPLPTAMSTYGTWYDLGWITDNGVTQAFNQTETKKYGWQGGGILRVLRSQFEKTFAFEAAEENAATQGLFYPGSTNTVTGGTAEVQSITFTGTGTAGTWTASLPGYGSAATGLAYNIATSALATALTAAWGVTVTVGGTVGAYTVTFPSSAGNVPQPSFVNNITGVTAINPATTTPGVNPINTRAVVAYSGLNARQFVIDAVDGSVHKRIYIPNGEAVPTGSVVLKGSDDTIFQFTINTYPDAFGAYFYDINDNSAIAFAWA